MGQLSEILGYGKIRAFNIGLLLISVCLVLSLITIWGTSISGITKISSKPRAKSPDATRKEAKGPAEPSYDVIVEKDLFRESRRKFVYKPPPPPPVKVAFALPPEPPPKRPPPKLSLIGTVLLAGSNAAIIEYGGKSVYYRVGESIEEFVVKKIDMDYVLLERDGEFLRIGTVPDR